MGFAVLIARPGYLLLDNVAVLPAAQDSGVGAQLYLSIDYQVTGEYVTGEGFVDVIQDKISPEQSDATAIIDCANYVGSLHQQVSQWQLSSPDFWQSFAATQQCYNAFHVVTEATGLAESTAVDEAGEATSDFFEDWLPKIESLIGEDIFR